MLYDQSLQTLRETSLGDQAWKEVAEKDGESGMTT